MNKDVQAILKDTVVETVSINLDPDKLREGNIHLSAEGKAELRIPKEEDDLSILLVSSTEIKSQMDKNAFYASFVVNFFFSIEKKPDDYDEVVRKQCLPIIQIKTKELADKFLGDMGFPEIFKEDEQT